MIFPRTHLLRMSRHKIILRAFQLSMPWDYSKIILHTSPRSHGDLECFLRRASVPGPRHISCLPVDLSSWQMACAQNHKGVGMVDTDWFSHSAISFVVHTRNRVWAMQPLMPLEQGSSLTAHSVRSRDALVATFTSHPSTCTKRADMRCKLAMYHDRRSGSLHT